MDRLVNASAYITRKTASTLGLKRYFTGKPCPNGHVAERFVGNRACIECTAKTASDWDRANPDKRRERVRRYRVKCGDRIRPATNARKALIRARATPDWAQRDAILVFYWMADVMTRRTKVKHHVDHYYPLNGENSCGLHIPSNLQVLPRALNLKKGNKLPKQNDCQIKADEHTVALLERGKINGRHETE